MNTAQVIPFQFDAREVRTMLIDDQPWFVAADVCQALAVRNNRDALSRLDEDEKGVATTDTLGGSQAVGIINESGLYSLILTSRKTEAKRFKKWITAEVLPAIRRTGQYHDSSNKMATLVDALIGMTEVNVLKGLIRDKAKVVPLDKRRSFQQTMHNRLHTRFNVPRIELIQAGEFEAACNFVAAYALEGEWLKKSSDIGTVLNDHQLYDVYFVCHHFDYLHDIFKRHGLYKHLTGLGSKAGIEMIDHFRDGSMGSYKLRSSLGAEFDAVQKRLGLNQYSSR